MKYPTLLSLSLTIATSTFLLLSGCTTTESGSTSEVAEPVVIEKGMPSADLLAALGEPYEIVPANPPVEGSEVWVYRKVNENTELVVSGMVETPAMDIGGVQLTVKDPVYTPATSRSVEETQFLIVDGVMVAWKQNRDESSRLD